MKIYTRTGDSGDTSLFDGTRVPKSNPRVEAYGEVDELSAVIGAARSATDQPDIAARLEAVQRDLFALGSRLADPGARISERIAKAKMAAGDVARLEKWIDEYEESLPPLRHFILPGGGPAGAILHVARTVCRRVERRIVSLGPGAVDPLLLVYLNRLSDFLFVLARAANHRSGQPEVEW
ncbi:MAG: cob(I)yrinic acid a,c-diamide adenosyltransferase [Vicinamibacterales bacterium]